MHIGIDVGGTNTDAVLMDGRTTLAGVKNSTSPAVTSGIVSAIEALRQARGFDGADIDAVMIGTTHFINALVQAKRLAPTAALRLGLPATKWLAELGAFVLRSDTELLLKSRRVVPGRLRDAGFEFEHPNWPAAAQDLLRRSRAPVRAAG